jgi:hypothetical protein
VRYVIRGEAIGRAEIEDLLDAHWALALSQAKRGPLPDIYQFGKYELDVPGEPEDWFTPSALIGQAGGRSDCNDFAVYRAAYLQQRGIDAVPMLMRVGPGYHVVVQLPDGSIEDPSARLGMPIPGAENVGMFYQANGFTPGRFEGPQGYWKQRPDGGVRVLYRLPGGYSVQGFSEQPVGALRDVLKRFGSKVRDWWEEDSAMKDAALTATNAARAFGEATPAGRAFGLIRRGIDRERGELAREVSQELSASSRRSTARSSSQWVF